VATPDPAIFDVALCELGVIPHQTLMPGDCASHAGAATGLALTTLPLVPWLTLATSDSAMC
jgi:FMN phosphatase YigB (HAD superfamily)